MWPPIVRAQLGYWPLVFSIVVGGCAPEHVVFGPEDVERWIGETREAVCTDQWPCSQDDEDRIVAGIGLPYGAESYWRPSNSEVRQFKQSLSLAFAEARGRYSDPPSALWLYGVQYIGYVRDGRRRVYAQGYRCWDVGCPDASDRWFSVHDGGTSAFGASFDPETGGLLELRFHGTRHHITRRWTPTARSSAFALAGGRRMLLLYPPPRSLRG